MALRTVKDWSSWLSDLFTAEESQQYATSLVESQITEEELSELNHELLKEMNITVTGHRMKILKKAKGTNAEVPVSTKMIKSDIKLPHITMNCSPSQFRKFLIDWDIYKSEHHITGFKCNKLIYSACDEALQNSFINGVPGFLEISEEKLIQYIKDTATKLSNPTVYRLSFQRLDQLEHHTIDQYIDTLRDKSIDCEFICPSKSCQHNYADFAIRDRFIQGLYDKKIQTNILAHISALPTLQDVIKHAKSIEAAKNDVSSMEVLNKKEQDESESYVNRVSSYKKMSQHNTQPSNSQPIEEPCTGCGKNGHSNYPARKANCPAWGIICNKCGVRNHFANVCKRTENTALALIAHTGDHDQNHNTFDLLQVKATPVCANRKIKSVVISVYPDSGADLCLAGIKHMHQMGLSTSDLNSSKKSISTAGRYKIKTFGWCNIIFNYAGTETRQQVYFSQQIHEFYLSKGACKGINILPLNFPYSKCNSIGHDELNTTDNEVIANIPQSVCNKIVARQTMESSIMIPDPTFPFQQIAASLFNIEKHNYLILVDCYSGWFTISYFRDHQATARNLVSECSALFSAYRAPDVFSCDGNPQFKGHEFQSFLDDWGIHHHSSHPQLNRRAEATVETAKRIIREHVIKDEPMDHTRIAQAVLQYRNTPLPHFNLSPAQLLFHCQLRDNVSTHPSHLKLHKKWELAAKRREVLYRQNDEVVQMAYNTKSKGLRPLKPRTKVLLLTNGINPQWSVSGIVVMSLSHRRYKIRLDGSGRIVVRNRKFLCEYLSQNAREDAVDSLTALPVTPLVNPVSSPPVY